MRFRLSNIVSLVGKEMKMYQEVLGNFGIILGEKQKQKNMKDKDEKKKGFSMILGFQKFKKVFIVRERQRVRVRIYWKFEYVE